MNNTNNNHDTRVALITGAARRIGAVIAKNLHQRGMDILIHCHRSTEEGQSLVNELNKQRSDSAVLLSTDLCNPDAVRRLAADAHAWKGSVHLLVNNASSFYSTPLGQATDNDWEQLVHSNLRAPYLLVNNLYNTLKENRGCVINLVDIYAEKPLLGHSLYCMAKAGLAMMTQALAHELGPEVRINGVAPGPILWPEYGQQNNQAIIDSTALKRHGNPEDIAAAVAFLALDAPFVTGQILAVDGGRSLLFESAGS